MSKAAGNYLVMRAPLPDVMDHIFPRSVPQSRQSHKICSEFHNIIPTSTILFNIVPCLSKSVDDQIIHAAECLGDLFLDIWGGIPGGGFGILTLPGDDEPIADDASIAKPIFLTTFFSKAR